MWEDGNNVLALEPGVVVAYDRNDDTNTRLRKVGIEVITIPALNWDVAVAAAIACPVRCHVTLFDASEEDNYGF